MGGKIGEVFPATELLVPDWGGKLLWFDVHVVYLLCVLGQNLSTIFSKLSILLADTIKRVTEPL